MKKLYIIGGTMGVGKTTVCRLLKKKLDNAVLLDGDWCWDSDPFIVTEETKAMVTDNICYLLNNFLRCSAYENIIFCWVMHRQDIIDNLLSRIETSGCRVMAVSLLCDLESLKRRLYKDIVSGLRDTETVERSIERLFMYGALNTVKIDVSDITPDRAAELIAKL